MQTIDTAVKGLADLDALVPVLQGKLRRPDAHAQLACLPLACLPFWPASPSGLPPPLACLCVRRQQRIGACGTPHHYVSPVATVRSTAPAPHRDL